LFLYDLRNFKLGKITLETVKDVFLWKKSMESRN
jgi:hypothetical protein